MVRSPETLAALASVAGKFSPELIEAFPVTSQCRYQRVRLTDTQGRQWLVRAALSDSAGAELLGADALARMLNDRMALQVPLVHGKITPEDSPVIAVYPVLPGNETNWRSLPAEDELVKQLGEVLAQVHDLNPSFAEACGVPTYDAHSYRERLYVSYDRMVASGQIPQVLLSRWEKAFDSPALWQFAAALTHGPVHGNDVLVDSGNLTALGGWERAEVSDPARDFTAIFSAGNQPMFDVMFETYAVHRHERPDPAMDKRVQLYAELEQGLVLLRALDNGDAGLVESQRKHLSRLSEMLDPEETWVPPLGDSSALGVLAENLEDMTPVPGTDPDQEVTLDFLDTSEK